VQQGTGSTVGIFATRGPRQMSPIGLSLVQLLSLTEGGIAFAGVDLVDGTPGPDDH
jgi:tRNA (Thr-GGU) A37 N-methylase